MNSVKLLTFLFGLAISLQAFAYGLSPDQVKSRCKELITSQNKHSQQSQRPMCRDHLSQGILDNMSLKAINNVLSSESGKGEIYELTLFTKKLDSINEKFQTYIEEWRDFKRWLVEPNRIDTPEVQEEVFENMLNDAQLLIESYLQHEITHRRLQACLRFGCSASRRIELEDQRNEIERWKITLASQNLWWPSESFDRWAQAYVTDHLESGGGDLIEISDSARKDLHQILDNNMIQFFEHSAHIRSQINSMRALEQHSEILNNSRSINSPLFLTFSSRYPEGFDFALSHFLFHSDEAQTWQPWEKEVICSLAKKRSRHKQRFQGLQTGAEWSLIGASLATGPDLFTPAVMSRLSRLFPSLRAGTSSRVALLTPEALLTAQYSSEYLNLKETCQNLQNKMRLIPDQKDRQASLGQISDCHEQRRAALIQASLGAAATSALSLPIAARTVQNFNTRNSVESVQNYSHSTEFIQSMRSPHFTEKIKSQGHYRARIQTDTGDVEFTLMDLARKDQFSQPLRELPENYWQHVADVYNQRLHLTPSEIESFIQSSRQLEPRTRLIVQTTRGPPQQIKGGVAYVQSSSTAELLPLEKATNFRVPSAQRSEGKVIEIVRLSSSTDSGADGMSTLLAQTSQMIRNDPDIKHIYVFTSKVHKRLYQKLNIPYQIADKPNTRDLIFHIKAEDFVRAFQ